MKQLRFLSAVGIALSFLFSTNINADTKFFARSYSAYTLPAKALEFEFWQTGRIGKGAGYYYRWQPRFEVEYGVTDRLTASMYFNFKSSFLTWIYEEKKPKHSYSMKEIILIFWKEYCIFIKNHGNLWISLPFCIRSKL